MANAGDKYVLEQVEDYAISDIVIRNSVGKRLNVPIGVITELNIFEDIDNNAVTGSMYLIDNYNIVTQAELQGNERLSFKLSTPGRQTAGFNHIVDASEESGYPYHIYAVKQRKPSSETTMVYEVLFASRELMMNTRKRVNRAYTGRLDQQVIKILRDDNGINTKKRILFEPTRNRDTIVMPNLRPFDAINLLASKALSGNAKGAGYYFYETTKAFYFRSVENMIADQSTEPRKVSRVFKYERPEATGPVGARRFRTQNHNIIEYRFIQNFNTLTNQAAGTYASNVITYNIFDKSYDSRRYKYHDHYQRLMHTDTDKELPETKRSYPIAQNPVDRERKEGNAIGDKTVSDYPESRIILQPSTRFLHNDDTGVFGTSTESEGITEAIRVSQRNQVTNSTRLEIVTSGASDLEVGDMIQFEMPKMIPGGADPQDYKGDDKYSGRYLVTKLRHRIMNKSYRQVLHCIKDSVVTNHIEDIGSNFPDKEPPGRLSQDLYVDPIKSGATGPNPHR
tara:strand:- start:1003 stop:2529 length:1527 start_codon:yes stop_codon:yes gene_type:complete